MCLQSSAAAVERSGTKIIRHGFSDEDTWSTVYVFFLLLHRPASLEVVLLLLSGAWWSFFMNQLSFFNTSNTKMCISQKSEKPDHSSAHFLCIDPHTGVGVAALCVIIQGEHSHTHTLNRPRLNPCVVYGCRGFLPFSLCVGFNCRSTLRYLRWQHKHVWMCTSPVTAATLGPRVALKQKRCCFTLLCYTMSTCY